MQFKDRLNHGHAGPYGMQFKHGHAGPYAMQFKHGHAGPYAVQFKHGHAGPYAVQFSIELNPAEDKLFLSCEFPKTG